MKIIGRIKLKFINIFIFSVPIFLVLFIYFRHQPFIQLQLLIISAIAYLIVALLHHHQDKSLKPEVIIEYALIALLVVIIFLSQLSLY